VISFGMMEDVEGRGRGGKCRKDSIFYAVRRDPPTPGLRLRVMCFLGACMHNFQRPHV